MSASYVWRKERRTWLVTVHWNRTRERIKVDTEQTAKDLVRYVHKLELAGTNVIEAIRQARTASPAAASASGVPTALRLRDALPVWLDGQARAGEIRASTARSYLARLRVWCDPHPLADGRVLGDVPVVEVTREMLGAMIRQIREAGRSLAVIEGVRNPLRAYYADLIERKHFVGAKPSRRPQVLHRQRGASEGPTPQDCPLRPGGGARAGRHGARMVPALASVHPDGTLGRTPMGRIGSAPAQ